MAISLNSFESELHPGGFAIVRTKYEDRKMNLLFANLRQDEPAVIEAPSAIPYHLIFGLIQTFGAEWIIFRESAKLAQQIV